MPPGATVTINNLDGVEHTVTATDGSFDSGVVASASAVAFVLPNAPGPYSLCARSIRRCRAKSPSRPEPL